MTGGEHVCATFTKQSVIRFEDMYLLFLLLTMVGGSNEIPTNPEFILGGLSSASGEHIDSPVDIELSNDGHIYVLDGKKDNIQKYTFDGAFVLEMGRSGAGPGELTSPAAIEFVDDELWVLDRNLARITVFAADKYLRTIKVSQPTMPESLVPFGDDVLIAGGSLFFDAGIEVFSKSGQVKDHIALNAKLVVGKGPRKELWSGISVEPFGNQILIGYEFFNAIAIVDRTGEIVQFKDMSDFYNRYEEGGGFPAGYAAGSFGEGPGETILVATCSLEERTCNEVFQFSKDLKHILSKRTYGGTVRKIRLFKDFGFLVFIVAGDNEIFFYSVT